MKPREAKRSTLRRGLEYVERTRKCKQELSGGHLQPGGNLMAQWRTTNACNTPLHIYNWERTLVPHSPLFDLFSCSPSTAQVALSSFLPHSPCPHSCSIQSTHPTIVPFIFPAQRTHPVIPHSLPQLSLSPITFPQQEHSLLTKSFMCSPSPSLTVQLSFPIYFLVDRIS